MKLVLSGSCLLVVAILLPFNTGCGSQPGTATDSGASADAGDHDGHDHADGEGHGHAAPHGGHLVELGRNHQYHVEWVDHDDSGAITLYVLDADMKELPVAKELVVVNLTVDGAPQSVELVPAGGADGKASSFTVANAALAEQLGKAEKVVGKVTVTFDGSPYVGSVEIGRHDHDHADDGHDHDHDGHDHDGDHDDEHDHDDDHGDGDHDHK